MSYRTFISLAAVAILGSTIVSTDALAWRAGYRAGGVRVGGVYRGGAIVAAFIAGVFIAEPTCVLAWG